MTGTSAAGDACQISERYKHYDIQSGSFETSRDLTVRSPTALWMKALAFARCEIMLSVWILHVKKERYSRGHLVDIYLNIFKIICWTSFYKFVALIKFTLSTCFCFNYLVSLSVFIRAMLILSAVCHQTCRQLDMPSDQDICQSRTFWQLISQSRPFWEINKCRLYIKALRFLRLQTACVCGRQIRNDVISVKSYKNTFFWQLYKTRIYFPPAAIELKQHKYPCFRILLREFSKKIADTINHR